MKSYTTKTIRTVKCRGVFAGSRTQIKKAATAVFYSYKNCCKERSFRVFTLAKNIKTE